MSATCHQCGGPWFEPDRHGTLRCCDCDTPHRPTSAPRPGRRVRPTGDLYHRVIPPGAVYVGRPGRWGNPYPVREHGLTESRRLFRAYLADHPELVDRARRELAGRDLACWCKPDTEWCHADAWLAAIREGS